MRYDGPAGMMLDLVGPSPDGVDLEWNHPYAYVSNIPTQLVDGSGLSPADVIRECRTNGCVVCSGLSVLMSTTMWCGHNCPNWCDIPPFGIYHFSEPPGIAVAVFTCEGFRDALRRPWPPQFA